jgi:LysM repeat protein
MNETLEKPPGVYVRENEHPPGHELDLLWSGSKAGHFKDERSAVLFFGFGLVVGILITAAISFFVFIKPTIKTGESVLTVPVTEESRELNANQTTVSPSTLNATPANPPEKPKDFFQSIFNPQPSTPSQNTPPESTTSVDPQGTTAPTQTQQTPGDPASPSQNLPSGASSHTVKSGETMGSIAIQYYGSSSPEMIEKITRANGLKNPNALKLDQTLVIPPKSY